MSGGRDTSDEVTRLRNARPRDSFVRVSAAAAVVASASAWASDALRFSRFAGDAKAENLQLFFEELRPFPLQARTFDLDVALGWAREQLEGGALDAALATAALGILAIVAASVLGGGLALLAARTLATSRPYDRRLELGDGDSASLDWREVAWRFLRQATRVLMALLRGVPEYIWAFLLLGLLGPTAWVAIIALAIHNAGILGRLGAETLEDAPSAAPSALAAAGAGRAQILIFGLLPMLRARLLVYGFYRFEACLREATVLGMLGIATLGAVMDEARARAQYDVLFFAVLLALSLVLLADLASSLARRSLRPGLGGR